jgi:hypothetical protein
MNSFEVVASSALEPGETMTLENVPHGLITDRVAPMLQGPRDAVIAPTAVFLGQAHYQGLQFCVDHGSTCSLPLLGAIELLCHQLPVPGEDRIRG